jgi:Concanavalin A-like lectin/glucanases superfamily
MAATDGFDDAAPAGDRAMPDAAPPVDAVVAVVPFCDPTDARLVACYQFENNLTDASSYHNSSTASASYAVGKFSQALLVGTVNGIDIADSASFDVTDLTIEAWISPSTIPTGTNRAGILDCEGQYGFFLHPNGDLVCTAGGSVTATAQIQANRWTHVACTHDATTITIYADGKAITTGTAGVLPTANTTGITLGGNNPAGGGSPLNGLLDQVRLFGIARTAAQICVDAGRTDC